ncbi:MAG TPA: glycosyltransferase [Acidimicrobiia bacterium]|nr:glycosyltransferase [Acidimicrobiia bacterium]
MSTDRIKVLVLIKGLGLGGAEILVAEAAPLWDRSRFEYRVAYMLPWKDQLVAALHDAEVPVDALDWRRPPGLRAAVRLRRLARRWQPDIVHSHLPAAGLLARLSLRDRTHVYTEHNLVTSYRPITRLLNRATYARNRAVIAVSQAVADDITGHSGPLVRVIPNGVSMASALDGGARAELGLGSGDRLVVHVGNIRPHKGHATLVAAARLLVNWHPNVTVVSVGGEKHAGDLKRMRKLAADSGLGDHMRFLGRRSDARSFLAAADVVVNPADVEGLPVSLLEALALARPVVATAVGGVPTVIRHEVTGLLVRPGEPVELASALERALTAPDAAYWGQEGARLVNRDFGLDRMVRQYESLYLELVGA